MDWDISGETIRIAYEIYSRLEDALSQKIFINKLLYAITREETYIYEILRDKFERVEGELAAVSEEEKLIIYGAGANCEIALNLCNLYGRKVFCICDRDVEKQRIGYRGYSVISPQELIKNYKDAVILVSTTTWQKEVKEFLTPYFSEEKQILLAEEKDIELIREQYFAKDIIQLKDGEVFVDGGCFDFETSKLLMEKCTPSRIYAFEPDTNNLQKVRRAIEDCKTNKVVLIQKGLWNCEDVLRFSARGDIQSRISSDGEERIEVTALDEVITERVTFIKMDIEGSELKALEGAKNIIQRDKPKLAICIYHKPEDTIDIPAYILSLVPEYKFYIRHYSYSAAETVLYAVL